MRKQRVTLVAVLVFLALLYSPLCNVRFTGLAAAEASPGVKAPVTEIGQVGLPWGRVYVLDSADGPRTVMCPHELIVWHCTVTTVIPKVQADAGVETVGWMSYTHANGRQVTVLAVQAKDLHVAYVEAGPVGDRERRPITPGHPVILSWERAMFPHDLSAVALAVDGTVLYEYRYPANTTTLRDDELRWYTPAPSGSN